MNVKTERDNIIWFVMLVLAEVLMWLLFTGFKVSVLTMIVITGICVFSAVLLYREGKKPLDLLVVAKTMENGRVRNPVFDWIRVIALCMVIITHSVQYDLTLGYGTNQYTFFHGIYVLTLMCNALFLVLTGALVLNEYHDTPMKFYFSKVVPRLFIPIVLNLILVEWRNGNCDLTSWKSVSLAMRSLWVGGSSMPILGFMLHVLVIYLAVPYIAKMVQNLSFYELTILVLTCMVFDGFRHFVLPVPAVFFDFSGYIGICITGAWLVRKESEKYRRIIGVASIICIFIIALWVNNNYSDYSVQTHSPVMYVLAAGVFNLIYYRRNIFRENRAITIISRYSFPALFVHMVLVTTRTVRYGIHTTAWNGIGIVVSLMVSLLLSMGAGFAIENTLVYSIRYVYKSIYEMTVRLTKDCENIDSKGGF